MTQLITHLKHTGTKQSYDNKSFFELLPCGATVFGIFDAHLECHSARFARTFIREYLSHNLPKCREMESEKIKNLLHKAFENCQLHMMVHKNAEKFVRSGCSATVGIAINASLWIANVGDSRCVIVDQESPSDVPPRTVTALHTLATPSELIRVIKEGSGWYEGDLVCNKVRVTRALGDLWQIGAFAWQPDTNLRFLNIKALRENDATVDTVREVMERKPPAFCISYTPHIHHEDNLSDALYIAIYTASALQLTSEQEMLSDLTRFVKQKAHTEAKCPLSDEVVDCKIAGKKATRRRFHCNNVTALIFHSTSRK